MDISEADIDRIQSISSSATVMTEGGITYLFIRGLRLPDRCTPNEVDALFCPMQDRGYPSRLYFSCQLTGVTQQNWNSLNIRILDRSWFAFSWLIQDVSNVFELLLLHIKPLY